MKRHDQHGFTLIELLIATTVFASVLLIISMAIINIGKSYYKGTNQARTQGVARNIIDEIGRGIQFSGSDVTPTTGTNYPTPGNEYHICVNNTMYVFVIDKSLGSPGVSKALIAQDNVNCATAPTDLAHATGRELLTDGMRLMAFNVQPAGTNTYKITVTVAIGGDATGDLLKRPPGSPAPLENTLCKGGADQSYCSVSKLETTVVKRV